MYRLREARSLQEILAEFRWTIPERYNAAYDACDRHASRGGLALVYEDLLGEQRKCTFSEMKRLSDELAAHLIARGVEAGDRIAIMLPPTPEAAATYLATLKIGAIAVPLSLLYGSESLVTRLVNCEPKVIVTTQVQTEKIHAQLRRLAFIKLLLVVGESTLRVRSLPWGEVEVCTWGDQKGATTRVLSSPKTRADDPALLIYTAGTSGEPKGVLLPHRAILSRIVAIQLAHHPFPSRGDLYWSPVDWAWVGGLVNSLLVPWILGVPVLTYERGTSFDPVRALEALETHQVRNCFFPPTALAYFRRQVREIRSRYKLDMRSMHAGGESLTPELLEWARKEFGVTVNEVYGMTEAGIVVGNCSPLMPVKPGSMGTVIPGHEVAILSESGRVATVGGQGLIAVRRRSPSLFLGYWGDSELTRRLFRRDWFITGDIATRNGSGYFRFVGRRDIVVKVSGYRVSPLEVEYLLSKNGAISRCAVVAVPDEERGSVLKAYIQLRKGYPASPRLAEEIQGYAKRVAGLHQYPREIEFVDRLPSRRFRGPRAKKVV